MQLPPRLRTTWERICFRPWTVPLGLLALLGLSFAWFLPQLGFYWDDWPVILTARLRGIDSFWRFYQYNRPLSAWIYIVTVPLLGLKPLHWQIFALLLRWLTTVSMWWTLTRVWPGHRRLAAWAALLFAVYPVFQQQPISVAYTQHWTCYLLFFISMGTMLQAQRMRSRPAWFWSLTAISVITFLAEILSMEYFSALELLRPILLWLVHSEDGRPAASRLKSVLVNWLPYLLGLAGFLIWRFFFMQLAREDVNAPGLLMQLITSPLTGGKRFAEIIIQDMLYLFFRAWTGLLDTSGLDLFNRISLLSWFVAGVVSILAFIYLLRLEDTRAGLPRRYSGMLIGLAAAVLGIFPVWATGRSVVEGMYANRFGLAAMFGTSLFLASLIEWLMADARKQALAIAILLGVASASHVQTANEYRWVWVSQTRFYWQLKWRAPQLEPKTAIFSEGEIFKYVGLYPTSAAVNMLYMDHMPSEELSYWFYSLGRDFAYTIDNFGSGLLAHSTLRNYTFTGNTLQGITINFHPTNDCLQVLSPADADIPGLEPLTRQTLKFSDWSRISPGPAVVETPPTDIFGPEPAHGWCYFYQKASLASQLQDWQQAAALADQAREQGYYPDQSASNTAADWLPIIQAYAHLGRWEDAQAISLAAYQKDSRIDARMCALWQELSTLPGAGDADTASVAVKVRAQMSCPK